MTGENKPRFFYGYFIVAGAFFIEILTFGTYTTFGVFFVPISSEFGWARALTSGPRALSFFLMGLIGIAAGRLNDRFGPRLVMTACGLFLGLAYLLMSQLDNVWQFYLFYGLAVGLGMSGVDVSLLSTSARWFTKKKGMISGIVKAGASAGMLVVPLLANWLILTYGWRTSYAIIGIFALVFIISIAQLLKRDPDKMGLLPHGDATQEPSLNLEINKFSLRQAILTRQFWILSVVYFLFAFVAHTMVVHLVPHVVDIGFSPIVAANILATTGGSGFVGRLIMGTTSDRLGTKSAIIIGLIILIIALLWLQLAGEVWMLFIFAVLYGFAHGALFTLMSPAVAEIFGLSSHGVIFGTVTFIGTVGGTIGPVMAGYIFDMTGSYQWAFLIFIAASITGFILTSLLRPIRSQSLIENM